jgi:hypothetical protein
MKYHNLTILLFILCVHLTFTLKSSDLMLKEKSSNELDKKSLINTQAPIIDQKILNLLPWARYNVVSEKILRDTAGEIEEPARRAQEGDDCDKFGPFRTPEQEKWRNDCIDKKMREDLEWKKKMFEQRKIDMVNQTQDNYFNIYEGNYERISNERKKLKLPFRREYTLDESGATILKNILQLQKLQQKGNYDKCLNEKKIVYHFEEYSFKLCNKISPLVKTNSTNLNDIDKILQLNKDNARCQEENLFCNYCCKFYSDKNKRNVYEKCTNQCVELINKKKGYDRINSIMKDSTKQKNLVKSKSDKKAYEEILKNLPNPNLKKNLVKSKSNKKAYQEILNNLPNPNEKISNKITKSKNYEEILKNLPNPNEKNLNKISKSKKYEEVLKNLPNPNLDKNKKKTNKFKYDDILKDLPDPNLTKKKNKKHKDRNYDYLENLLKNMNKNSTNIKSHNNTEKSYEKYLKDLPDPNAQTKNQNSDQEKKNLYKLLENLPSDNNTDYLQRQKKFEDLRNYNWDRILNATVDQYNRRNLEKTKQMELREKHYNEILKDIDISLGLIPNPKKKINKKSININDEEASSVSLPSFDFNKFKRENSHLNHSQIYKNVTLSPKKCRKLKNITLKPKTCNKNITLKCNENNSTAKNLTLKCIENNSTAKNITLKSKNCNNKSERHNLLESLEIEYNCEKDFQQWKKQTEASFNDLCFNHQKRSPECQALENEYKLSLKKILKKCRKDEDEVGDILDKVKLLPNNTVCQVKIVKIELDRIKLKMKKIRSLCNNYNFNKIGLSAMNSFDGKNSPNWDCGVEMANDLKYKLGKKIKFNLIECSKDKMKKPINQYVDCIDYEIDSDLGDVFQVNSKCEIRKIQ